MQDLFYPRTAVIVYSSKIKEDLGIVCREVAEGISYNMNEYFKGIFYEFDIEKDKQFPKVDLAIIVLKPIDALSFIEKFAENGVKAFIHISSNFTNNLRKKYREIITKYKIRVIGPNSVMGIINTENGLNTSFAKDCFPKKGNISIIAQSGGVGASLLDDFIYYNIGIAKFIFTGEKIDVDDIELIKYLAEDEQTKVIGIYMEGIKKEGRKFLDLAKKVARKKPILVLKSGITKESAKRILSHTFSLAGKDEIYSGAFKGIGIVRVLTIEQLVNAVYLLSFQRKINGNKIAVISNVGGIAILTADLLSREGFILTKFTKETEEKIKEKYPKLDIINPLDIIANAKANRFKDIIEIIDEDENTDAIIVINMVKSCLFDERDAEELAKIKTRKLLIDICGGENDFLIVRKKFENSKIPIFKSPNSAIDSLKILFEYSMMSIKQRKILP